MAGKDMIENVTKFIQPIVNENGFELFDIEFVKEGTDWFFRVYIDKETGITIDDCELISRKVEKLLDEKDPIPQAYILEVSSPGINRALKKDEDYVRYAGKIVDIKLYKPFNKSKEYQGKLQGLSDGVVTIADESGKDIGFAKADIASCRLAVIF